MAADNKEDSHPNEVAELRRQVQALTARFAKLEANYAAMSASSSNVTSKATDTEVEKAEKKKGDAEPVKNHLPWHVRFITNRRDPSTGERKDFEDFESHPQASNRGGQGAAAALKIFIDDAKKGSDEVQPRGQLEIFNDNLRELLKTLLAHHPTHDFYTDFVTIDSPFEPLIMNWDNLIVESKKESQTETDRVARRGLNNVLEMLQRNTGDVQLDDYMSNRESLNRTRTITFDALWTIFPPGTIVYGCPYLKQHQVFIVRDNITVWPEPDEDTWTLECWTYDWNGQGFQRRRVQLNFKKFSGLKPIASLPYYPLSESKEKDIITSDLIRRGRLYRKYCTAKADARRFKYKGRAIVDKTGFEFQDGSKKRGPAFLLGLLLGKDENHDHEQGAKESMVNSDVMVDFESYYQYGPRTGLLGGLEVGESSGECLCTHCSKNDALATTYCRKFDEAKGEETEEWDDLQYMLCPPRVLGYILRQKQWAQLKVDKITPVTDDRNAFEDKLHLKGDASLDGKETKMVLINLVSTHGQGQVKDIVEDKGKGLVILLYGSPGVGKTSTAETLAAAVGKPLLSIGVADVGTTATNVETNLKRIFDLAASWKAILLIDEVDVFVQSRGMGHQGPTTERNALVSVFLRVLEYYQGILILTTNQIALFDVAVQSRIHIAIKYSALDKSQAIAIFTQFLDQYHRDGLVANYEDIKRYIANDIAKKGFDGRQLRNIVTNAMGLAQGRSPGDPKMTLDDITTIVSNKDSFKTELEYQMRRYEEVQTGRTY